MRLARLAPFFAPVLATFVFACTAAPTTPTGSADDEEDGSEDNFTGNRDAGAPSTASGKTADASPTPTPAADAGTAPAPTPAPAGQACAQLSACCGSLQDSYDKYACMGVALYNEPSYCQPALVVCQGGGVGLSGAFSSILSGGGSGGGAGCSDLTRCCQQMTQRGDPLARQCDKLVQLADGAQCTSNLQTYRQQQKCN